VHEALQRPRPLRHAVAALLQQRAHRQPEPRQQAVAGPKVDAEDGGLVHS